MTTSVEHIPPTGAEHPDLGLLDRTLEHIVHAGNESFTASQMIDRIAHLESVKNSLDALQANLIRTFARTHVATRTADGIVDDPARLERSIAAQIGLACRISPTRGRSRLRTARDLHDGLDHVHARHLAGELNEHKTSAVVRATDHLDRTERAEVDRRLAEHDIAPLGVGRLRDLARSYAAQVAPEKFLAHSASARTDRRVTLRPASDGMTDLIAHLPADQGAACCAALHKAVHAAWTSPEPVTRGRGQIMADSLVERLTGRTTANDIDVEVQVVVPIEALIDPGSPLPAEIPGHGPVPADLLATTTGRKTWRRLVTRDGIVIGGDSRKRCFTAGLAALIRARDRYRCAEPYCDAAIRETDHIVQHRNGGLATFENGRGVCAFHNRLREQSGWAVERIRDGIRTSTPTGHTYLNTSAPAGCRRAFQRSARAPAGRFEE